MATITSLYTFLSDEDTNLECPVLSHRHYLREPQRLSRPVQDEMLHKFFAVIENVRDRAMFVLMLRNHSDLRARQQQEGAHRFPYHLPEIGGLVMSPRPIADSMVKLYDWALRFACHDRLPAALQPK
jgi:hypothetical protein